jgi:hypothetical protein
MTVMCFTSFKHQDNLDLIFVDTPELPKVVLNEKDKATC